MNNIIIYGAGFYGKHAYYKLHKEHNILCFVDNNPALWNNHIFGLPIISSSELLTWYSKDTNVVIATKAYYSISAQLISMGIKEFYVMMEGFLSRFNEQETMMPVEIERVGYYKKNEKLSILFVQNAACIRTHKIATIMKRQGYQVYLLYTLSLEGSNEKFLDVYDGIYTFTTYNGIVDFVINSEFDIIHSSNAPDILTNILLLTGKRIVFDIHDMNSLWGKDSIEELTLEHVANSFSAGNIYTSQGVCKIANEKFNLSNKEIFVLENTVLEEEKIYKYLDKLSSIDGQIHCVYEGGLVGDDETSDKYLEKIWDKIIANGIHIHFYSQADPDYCRKLEKRSIYLHYEGNLGSKELIQVMTQYDCGLAIFNVTEKNRVFVETGTANKVYEYLNAEIPVVVGDVDSYYKFVTKYGVGDKIDLSNNVKEQFENICKIEVPKNFLTSNNLTMMSKREELDNFYKRIIQQKGTKQFECE